MLQGYIKRFNIDITVAEDKESFEGEWISLRDALNYSTNDLKLIQKAITDTIEKRRNKEREARRNISFYNRYLYMIANIVFINGTLTKCRCKIKEDIKPKDYKELFMGSTNAIAIEGKNIYVRNANADFSREIINAIQEYNIINEGYTIKFI
ncbi:MAG: hypothetical protein ACLTDM_11270 [Clostridium butyricum]